MELIYLYIRKYGELFQDEEFNFSSNFKVSLKNNELIINKNEDKINNYYGNNVSNVSMFFGKNGVGKTTLLDILGISRNDRIGDTFTYNRNTNEKKSENYLYFIMYHLKDNYFAFEFSNEYFLKEPNKIKNFYLSKKAPKNITYKNYMGTIFYLNDNIFEYIDNVIQQELSRYDIDGRNIYAYITPGYHNTRLKTDCIDESTYMFSRIYYFDLKHNEYLYKYLGSLKDVKNNLFADNNIIISSNIRISFDNIDDEIKRENLEEYKKELVNLLKIRTDNNSKEKFINKLYKNMIVYYFFELLYGWMISSINANKSLLKYEDDVSNNVLKEYFNEEINNFSFNEEFEKLKLKIEEMKKENNEKNILKNILFYIINRVERVVKTMDEEIYDYNASNEILECFEKISNNYYKNDKLYIDFKNGIDEDILNLLNCYDKYYDYVHRERKLNYINNVIDIEFPKLSEGYTTFLNIIAKSCDAYNKISSNDNLILILDEPDRALHPELARCFLDEFLNALNNYKHKGTIQIVMSSHSPFIVTDILPEYVYLLKNDEIKENGKRTIITNELNTFATNIYYLLMESFMMKNTFGEYSYKKIEKIITLLKNKEKISNMELEDIKKIIDRISEDVVRKKLLELYNSYCQMNVHYIKEKNNLVEEIKHINDPKKLEQIRKILEKNDKNTNK